MLRNKLRQKAWSLLLRTKLPLLFSDNVFVKCLYWGYLGKRLDLKAPLDFNQKIQWLKINHRDPLMTACADKWGVRAFVEKRMGPGFLTDCIGVYDRVEDIDYAALPQKFVLKMTHASGWNIICQDKKRLDWRHACSKMQKWLRKDFSEVGREWQYREIKPRIICEKFINELETGDFMDYRLFTFNGHVKYILVEFNRRQEGVWCPELEQVGSNKPNCNKGMDHYTNFYTRDWEYVPHTTVGPAKTDEKYVERPRCLEVMIGAAEKLAKDFPFCRVDFYVIGSERVVFSELTFTPGKGCYLFSPESFAKTLGDCLTLPKPLLDKRV